MISAARSAVKTFKDKIEVSLSTAGKTNLLLTVFCLTEVLQNVNITDC